MIRAIIFSRDRACQLDLLLFSLEQFAPDAFSSICVLWRASAPDFEDAYAICANEHPRAHFLREDGLTYQVRSLLREDGLIIFLTDDDVLYAPIPTEAPLHEHLLERTDVLCFSLRLGLNTTICYPHSRRQRTPRLLGGGDILLWDWTNAELDFGYPMSVDGHIFRAADLRPLIEGRNFPNPNWLEDVLVAGAHEIGRPLMSSYRRSKLVSVPANRVNETHGNRFGTEHRMEAEELNSRYLAGERIDPGRMDFSSVVGAHHELAYSFEAV